MVPVLVIHITFSSDHRFGFYSGLGIACIYGRNILSMRLHKPVTDWLETLPRTIYRLNMKEKFLLDIIEMKINDMWLNVKGNYIFFKGKIILNIE